MSFSIACNNSQVMNRPVIVLRQKERVRRILQVLVECHVHSGFPVVEDMDPTAVVGTKFLICPFNFVFSESVLFGGSGTIHCYSWTL